MSNYSISSNIGIDNDNDLEEEFMTLDTEQTITGTKKFNKIEVENEIIHTYDTFTVKDAIIELNKDNTAADTTDSGFYSVYNAGSGVRYRGFINKAGTDKYYVFNSQTTQPTTEINTSNQLLGTVMVRPPTENNEAANKAYVDGHAVSNYLPLSGGTLTGTLDMCNNDIHNLSNLHFKNNTIDMWFNIFMPENHKINIGSYNTTPDNYLVVNGVANILEFLKPINNHGNITMLDNSKITGLPDTGTGTDAVNYNYLSNNYLPLSGTTNNLDMNKNNIEKLKLLKNDDTTNNIITIQGDKQTYRGLIDPTHERAANVIVENTIPQNQNLNNNTIFQIKNPNFLSSGGTNQITGACMLDFNMALSDYWNGGGTADQGNVIASARIENRSTKLNNYEGSDLVFHVCGDDGTIPDGGGGVLEEFLVMKGKTGVGTTDGIYAYKNINLENENSLTLGYYTTENNAPLKINNGQAGVLNNQSQIALGFDTGRLPHYITTRHNSVAGINNSIDFYTADGTNDNNLPQLNSTLNLSLNNGQIGIKKPDPQRDLDCNGTSIFRGEIDAVANLDMNNNNIEDINTLVWNNNEGRMIGTPEGLYIQTPQTAGDKKINFSEFQDSDIRFQIDIDNSKINAYNRLDMLNNRITFNEDDGSFILNDPTTGSENMAIYCKNKFLAISSDRAYTNTKLDMNTNKIVNVTEPTASTDVATKNYVDTHPSITGNYLKTDGTNSMNAPLNAGGYDVENVKSLNMESGLTSSLIFPNNEFKIVHQDGTTLTQILNLQQSIVGVFTNMNMNQNRIKDLPDIPTGGKDGVNRNFVMNQLDEYSPAFNTVTGTRPGTIINGTAQPMYDVDIPINIQGYLKVELYFPFLQSSGGSNKPVYQIKSKPNTVIQFSNGKFVYQGAGIALRHTGYIDNSLNQYNSITYRIEASTQDASTVTITHQDLLTSYNICRVSVA